ncbi:MAG TPA: hypothetical protein PK079_21230 [Leptospiraceae bacterium]|nr:hypothetical protein [Leptospiraceae bacterium]HMW06635.1 hypothetical protein [Leptospiraceae bacterium]HMX34271.1 hypothetical protein [Leptospiraceae bacterium]HMY32700.1 hypothetical protein [Leptospiraceae bacterium]HMZ64890.1 hypothetical protein [Leptospiraceae bacterium]
MFLNVTAHELTTEQRELAASYSDTIVDLKKLNPSLHERLVSCPLEKGELLALADELLMFIGEVSQMNKNRLTLHLPIGSPAFMALFFMKLDREKLPCRIVFSHSDRVSVDEKQEDGSVVKRAVFKFVKFIEI